MAFSARVGFAILTNGLRPSKVSDSNIRVVRHQGFVHPANGVGSDDLWQDHLRGFGGWLDGPS